MIISYQNKIAKSSLLSGIPLLFFNVIVFLIVSDNHFSPHVCSLAGLIDQILSGCLLYLRLHYVIFPFFFFLRDPTIVYQDF